MFTGANYERGKARCLCLQALSRAPQMHVALSLSAQGSPRALLQSLRRHWGHVATRLSPLCARHEHPGCLPSAPHACCRCELNLRVWQEHAV